MADDNGLAVPAAPNGNIQAGMQAIQQDPIQQVTQQYKPQFEQMSQQRQQVAQQGQQKLSQQPQVQAPQQDFHPMIEDNTKMAGLMLFLAAMGGRRTSQPMTAAMNNMTGVMTGLHQGNLELVKGQKEQFDTNYQTAMDRYKEFIDERNEIYRSNNFDLAQIQQQEHDLELRFGVEIKGAEAKLSAQNKQYLDAQHAKELIDMHHQQAIDKLENQRQHDAEVSQQKRDLGAIISAIAASKQAGTQPFIKLPDGTVRRLHEGENQLPQGATLAATGSGKSETSSHLTMTEEKAITNLGQMKFANQKLDELGTKGITAPISSEVFGKLYNPETGGLNSAIQQEMRSKLSSPQEQVAFDAALNYTMAMAHAAGGARPSGYQVEMIWNSDIPLSTDPQEVKEYKAQVRQNAIESITMSTGAGKNVQGEPKEHSPTSSDDDALIKKYLK